LQPLAGQIAGYIKSAALGIAHEGDALVLLQRSRIGQVALRCRQIPTDAPGRLSVKLRLLLICIAAEANQRYPDRNAFNNPWLVIPGVEDFPVLFPSEFREIILMHLQTVWLKIDRA
jgi:hypothetical protein